MKISETGRFNFDHNINAQEVELNVENLDNNFAGSTETFCLSASNDATSKGEQKFSENQIDFSQAKNIKISQCNKKTKANNHTQVRSYVKQNKNINLKATKTD